MNVTAGSIAALKRHYLGVLTAPPRVTLVAASTPRLLVTGPTPVRAGAAGCLVDLGTVESPGTAKRTLRVVSPGSEDVVVALSEVPSWLKAQWRHVRDTAVPLERDGVTLELQADHDTIEKVDYSGTLAIRAVSAGGDEHVEQITVRMTAQRSHPLGRYAFGGQPEPRGVDFGLVDPASSSRGRYEMSFENAASVPLLVQFADLPPWLTFAVDGRQRTGPIEGCFFERMAPFTATIAPVPKPEHYGRHQSTLRLLTNDGRPGLRNVDLELACVISPAHPHVRVAALEEVRCSGPEPVEIDLEAENWGRTTARLSSAPTPGLELRAPTNVPPARDGTPGRANVPLRALPSELTPGTHPLSIVLRVYDGQPPEIIVPIVLHHATQSERRMPLLRPEPVFAVLAFLVLLVSLVLSRTQ